MSKWETLKKQDNLNDGFSETLRSHVMHQANVSSNHNKYYVVELQKNSKGQFRIFTHYGRLGITNIYEVRELMDGKQCFDQAAAEKEFEAIHQKKLRGKSVKNEETGETEREAYVDVDVVSPQVGSENIRGKAETKKTVTAKAAIDTRSFDKEVADLMKQLVAENIHNITTNTTIKYTTNGFATELGPVTPSHVVKARAVLDELNKLMGKKGAADSEDREVQRVNSSYFSLIPKPFSMKISATDMILDANALQAEYDILDQLETGVQMGASMAGSTSQQMNALGTDVELLTDSGEIKRITAYVRGSKAGNHRGSDVWDFDVARIYKVRIPDERARYDAALKKFGGVQEVFHGSANSNLLSIVKHGLIIPPASAGHVTGRMFSDGVYGANNSTKSLNYSIGYWGGRRSKYGNAFLFLADFAMGKTFVAHNSEPNGPPRGYNSIWAKKGSSLHNDELIVYTLPQCTLKYLVEMRK